MARVWPPDPESRSPLADEPRFAWFTEAERQDRRGGVSAKECPYCGETVKYDNVEPGWYHATTGDAECPPDEPEP